MKIVHGFINRSGIPVDSYFEHENVAGASSAGVSEMMRMMFILLCVAHGFVQDASAEMMYAPRFERTASFESRSALARIAADFRTVKPRPVKVIEPYAKSAVVTNKLDDEGHLLLAEVKLLLQQIEREQKLLKGVRTVSK